MQQRDTGIDVLRGFVILQMIANHVSPGGIIDELLHPFETVRATVGFVLFSGYVAGLVYHRRMLRGQVCEARRALLRRARKIYFIHLLLVAALVAGSWLLTGQKMAIIESYGYMKTAILTATLRWQHSRYMNILPMYVVFLAMAPALFHALQRGKARILLLASTLLYFAGWRWPAETSFVERHFSFDAFPLIQWQLIFCLGALAGFHREKFLHFLHDPAFRLHRRLGLIFLLGYFIVFDRPLALLGLDNFKIHLAPWLRQFPIGPIRLAASLLFNIYAYLLVKNYMLPRASPVLYAVLQRLTDMGQHSLMLFVLHLVPALSAHPPSQESGLSLIREAYLILVLFVLLWSIHQRWILRLVPN